MGKEYPEKKTPSDLPEGRAGGKTKENAESPERSGRSGTARALERAVEYLRSYDGPERKLMEVCGTHTAALFKTGVRSLLSPKIRLIAGPGCPVCVTPTAYVDRCIEYACRPGHVLVSFGDMLKVPGKEGSLSDKKGQGARVELMYSPFEVLEKAEADPETIYVIAAVGFETTAPAFALTLQAADARGIENIRMVTALKTVLPALEWVCSREKGIDGFLCPGHVSVIIGSDAYRQLAEASGKPFSVAGFEAEHLIAAIYYLVRRLDPRQGGGPAGGVENLYRSAVRQEGNPRARQVLETFFEPGPAVWRGLGRIEDSGLYLKPEFSRFDGGSRDLAGDRPLPPECCCSQVITGRKTPSECPMFGKACTPEQPFGPCMVSAEGACGIWYQNERSLL